MLSNGLLLWVIKIGQPNDDYHFIMMIIIILLVISAAYDSALKYIAGNNYDAKWTHYNK